MAIIDFDLVLEGTVSKDVLLGSSNSIIVQNVTNRLVRYKIKDSVSLGGIMAFSETFGFATDMTFWVDDCNHKTSISRLYCIRG